MSHWNAKTRTFLSGIYRVDGETAGCSRQSCFSTSVRAFFDHIRVPVHRFLSFIILGKIVSFVNFLKNGYMYFTSSIALEQFNSVTCESVISRPLALRTVKLKMLLKSNLSGCQRARLEFTLLIPKSRLFKKNFF